jgi:hypothetical protein
MPEDRSLPRQVIAPDGTVGTVVAGPDAHRRVKVEWDDGTVSWSQLDLLREASGAL